MAWILCAAINLAFVVAVVYAFKHFGISLGEFSAVSGLIIALIVFFIVAHLAGSKLTKKDPAYQFTTTDKEQRNITVYSKTDISNLSLISIPEHTHFNIRANFVLYEALTANHEFTDPSILYLIRCKDGVMFITSYVDGKFIRIKYPQLVEFKYFEDSISLGFSIIGIAHGLVKSDAINLSELNHG